MDCLYDENGDQLINGVELERVVLFSKTERNIAVMERCSWKEIFDNGKYAMVGK